LHDFALQGCFLFCFEISKGEIKGEIKLKIMHIINIMNSSENHNKSTILATSHIIPIKAQNEVQVPSPAYEKSSETYYLQGF
jgi:hypothetical protein